MLTKLKLILGITTSEQDQLLEQLLDDSQVLVEAYVVNHLVADEPLLQLIVVEMAVERYNKLGAEGMSSQDIEGYKRVYTSGSLDNFLPRLDMFLSGKKPRLTKVKRFWSV